MNYVLIYFVNSKYYKYKRKCMMEFCTLESLKKYIIQNQIIEYLVFKSYNIDI